MDITYGDDTSNQQTSSLPLDVTRPIKKNVLYWVMAQLQGSGRITCKEIIGKTARAGHAIGGYNTAPRSHQAIPSGAGTSRPFHTRLRGVIPERWPRQVLGDNDDRGGV